MPYLGRSGAERVVFNLLNQLSRDKFELHLLLYKNDPDRNSLLQDLNADVNVSFLNLEGRIRNSIVSFATKILKFCKEKKIDTLFISDGVSNAALSPFLFLFDKKVKKIARESNLPTHFEKSSIVRFLYKFFYRKYNTIVVQSNEMYSDLTQSFRIPVEKVIKINNPLDLDNVNRLSMVESECNFDKSKINLLSIGRLTYQKGFDLLLNSFSNFKNDNYHLTIIGDGEEKNNLKELVKKLNILEKVTFIDATDNPYNYMKQSDVFVSSSRWEGYPNVVIESISCGTPVVANKYPGGIREIIDEHNGIICDIQLSGELENAIEKVVKLKHVSFDPEVNKKILLEYESVLL